MDGSTLKETQLSSFNNTSKQECEACRTEDECCSFTWSPTWRSCSLSSECEPSGPAHGDFFVCEKDYLKDVTQVTPSVVYKPGSDVASLATTSSLTIEVYCCNSDGSSAAISFYDKHTVRTCGNGVSCENICVTSQNFPVVSSGGQAMIYLNVCL